MAIHILEGGETHNGNATHTSNHATMHMQSGGGSIWRSIEERGHGAELRRIVRDVG